MSELRHFRRPTNGFDFEICDSDRQIRILYLILRYKMESSSRPNSTHNLVMTSSDTAHASQNSEATGTGSSIGGAKLTQTTDSMALCAEHACWSPLPISSTTALKEHLPEVIEVMRDRANAMYILDMDTFFVIEDGISEMNQIIAGGGNFCDDPCEACRVVDFFLGDGGFVFLMGLVRLEKYALYKACFEFMRGWMEDDKVEPYHRMMMCSGNPETEPMLETRQIRHGDYWTKHHGTVSM